MLGVPMLAGGNLVGVLHVGSYSRRTFSEDDVLLLELAADRIGSAVQAGIAESERRAAGVLQRSLLPSAFPRIAQFEFASRYAPAEMGGIGGDWYDAFVLPNGDVWVMTGDVAGHGLWAAVVMGRLRSALRAYALLGMAPEDVLQSANRKLQYFEHDATATVVCAVFSPPYDVVRMVSAGHPPPVMVAPGKEPILVPLSPAPPLGAVANLEAQSFSEFMEPGEVLLLYTDGLIERRGELLTEGLERLRVAVRPQDPEAVCRHVMDALIGNLVPQDDVALLALRRSPQVYLPAEAPPPTARHPMTRSLGRRSTIETPAQWGQFVRSWLSSSPVSTRRHSHRCCSWLLNLRPMLLSTRERCSASPSRWIARTDPRRSCGFRIRRARLCANHIQRTITAVVCRSCVAWHTPGACKSARAASVSPHGSRPRGTGLVVRVGRPLSRSYRSASKLRPGVANPN